MNKKRSVPNRSLPVSIAIGTVAEIIFCMVLSGFLATLIGRGSLREEGIGFGVLAVLFLTSCIGCILSAKLAKKQIAITCGISAATHIALLVAMNILFFDCVFTGWGSKLLAVLLGTIVSCILCAGKRRKKRTR